MLHPDRYFSPDSGVRAIARELYEAIAGRPLICPHGHVDPALLADNRPFPDPARLIIIPDHYIFRMLYSAGVPLERLGIAPRADGDGRDTRDEGDGGGAEVERDSRRIWQVFAEHFHLFRGTPTSCWLRHELEEVFGIETRLDGATAMEIYDRIAAALATPEFLPRALFERFDIETLATTDAATDTLEHHRRLRESGWKGDVRPTFRPDSVVQLLRPDWKREIERLGELTGREITSYPIYIHALESRRDAFRELGATATDHGVASPLTRRLCEAEAEAIFQRALAGEATEEDDRRFTAHMLMEFARMSVEDGLVMQIHPGSFRNHNRALFDRFGPDMGCDIPIATEFTRNLHDLLNAHGNDPRFRLVIFTLDESTYSRELAPLAGHYPALRLGPPWWFHDSLEGMRRFRRRVTETAGFANTAGFNDDTRAFPSIPARHDLSRRVDAGFLAELVAEHVIELDEAHEIAGKLAYDLAKDTYRLG